jgi:hypothetical protein
MRGPFTHSRFRLTLSVVAVASALAAGALPARAVGAEVRHNRFEGDIAEVEFSSFDGCVESHAFVGGMDGRLSRGPGRPDATSAAIVSLFRYDVCNGVPLVDAFAIVDLLADEFQIDRQLSQASLTTTVGAWDFLSGTTLPVHVDLQWTATGEPVRVRYTRHVDGPGFRMTFKVAGTERRANAEGSLSDGSWEYATASAAFAAIRSTSQADLLVHR